MHRIKALFFLLLPVVLLSACRNDLSDSQWVLTDIVGKTVPLSGKAYMRFHQNEKTFVDGSGGCNRFSGNFTVVGSALRVGPLISTRMACPDMREERAFFNALQSVDAYRLEQGELLLLRDGAPLLRFEAKVPSEGAE